MAAQALEIARTAQEDATRALHMAEGAQMDRETMSGRFDLVDVKFDRTHARLGGLERRLDRVDNRLERVEGRLHQVEGRLNGVDNRLNGVDNRLDRVEGRLDVHQHLLEALRETQVEQGKKINDGFSMVAVGMSQIAAQIANVEREIREDKGKA